MIHFFTRREMTAIWSGIALLAIGGWMGAAGVATIVGTWPVVGVLAAALVAGAQLWRIAGRPLRIGGDR